MTDRLYPTENKSCALPTILAVKGQYKMSPKSNRLYAAPMAADTTENRLQDCHDHIQSETDQHTSLHVIIDQRLHAIMNFTIIWQVTVVPTCHYSYIFSKGFCCWLTYHLEQTFVLLSRVDLLQLLTVLKANSKRFYLTQHMDLSSHRHQCFRFAQWHMALWVFIVLYYMTGGSKAQRRCIYE